VIDGGPVQLDFAKKTLDEMGLEKVPVVAIAKREELVYLTDREEPVHMLLNDEALKLLQRVRNESHRFAVNAHRRGYGNKLGRNALQDIPGVGKHKAANLLSYFGSVKNISSLEPEKLTQVEGIGPVLAEKIHLSLNGSSKEEGVREAT
jgi:excinuclease ABC subunit C